MFCKKTCTHEIIDLTFLTLYNGVIAHIPMCQVTKKSCLTFFQGKINLKFQNVCFILQDGRITA